MKLIAAHPEPMTTILCWPGLGFCLLLSTPGCDSTFISVSLENGFFMAAEHVPIRPHKETLGGQKKQYTHIMWYKNEEANGSSEQSHSMDA